MHAIENLVPHDEAENKRLAGYKAESEDIFLPIKT